MTTRFVLDTTYVMPAVGMTVKKVSGKDVANFRVTVGKEGSETAICDITIFELSAKGAKYVEEGKLEAESILRGVEAILNDNSLIKLKAYDNQNVSTAIELRKTLGDFIDCLIVSSAMNNADVLLTEDEYIHDLKRDEKFKELTRSMNPKFEIRRLSEIGNR